MRVRLIYLTNFFLTSALGVVFVFLEDVQTDNGLADWEVGLIAGNGFAAALVAQLLLSPMADRGRTRLLAILGLTAGIIGPIGFAYGSSLPVLAVSRGLTGIGLGLFGLVARKALIGLDSAGGGAKLGMLLSTAVAGFIIGPLIGAALEPVGFVAPFWFVSISLVVVGIPATKAIVASPIAKADVHYSDIKELLRRPRVQAAMLVQVIVFGYVGIFDATIDRFLTEEFSASTGTVAIVILFVGGPMLVLPRISGGLAERHGGSTVMLPALLVLVPVMLGYGIAASVVVATAVGFMHGVGESFASVSAQVLVLEVTGPERAAVGSGLLDASGLSAAALCAAVAPSLYGSIGQDGFLWAAGVATLLGALAYQRVRNAWD